MDPEYKERLQAALVAVRKAGNPYLERSLLAALEGQALSVRECFGDLHPEVDETLFPPESHG